MLCRAAAEQQEETAYLALVRELLACVCGDCCLNSSVERLDEGVWELFVATFVLVGWGVEESQSQVSAPASASRRLVLWLRLGSGPGPSFVNEFPVLRSLPRPFCTGVSMPTSFQNEASMSAHFVSLPELGPLLEPCRDDGDGDDRADLASCTDNLSFEFGDPRLRVVAVAEAGGSTRAPVPLIPSSPTVACLISSKKVQRPSLRSEAICLPVRTSASRDGGGGIVFRHCDRVSSAGCLRLSGVWNVVLWLRSTEGRVAARGSRPIRSLVVSDLSCSGSETGLRCGGSEAADRRESVRACEPWKTLRPFADTEVPAVAAAMAARML